MKLYEVLRITEEELSTIADVIDESKDMISNIDAIDNSNVSKRAKQLAYVALGYKKCEEDRDKKIRIGLS